MSKPTALKLVALDDGTEYQFDSIVQACEWLGRSKQYIRTGIYENPDKIIRDLDKREYYMEVIGIGVRKNAVRDPNRKKKEKLPPLFDENGEVIRRNCNNQLCWQCARASGFCNWSLDLKPVEGWTAKPTMIRHMSRGGCDNNALIITNSYKVKDCPLFIKDADTREGRIQQRKMLMEELENG